MNQNSWMDYQSSKDFLILNDWRKYFENQIKYLTSIWTDKYVRGINPPIPLNQVEKALKDYFKKRDYCKNRIDAKLSVGPMLEPLIL